MFLSYARPLTHSAISAPAALGENRIPVCQLTVPAISVCRHGSPLPCTEPWCHGRRLPADYLPSRTRRISSRLTTFITIRSRWTILGNSGTSGGRRGLCGGSLTGYVWKMIYRLSSIRNSTARAVSCITASGSGSGPRPHSKGYGRPLLWLWSKSPPTLRSSCG